jgi:hypothetical protein
MGCNRRPRNKSTWLQPSDFWHRSQRHTLEKRQLFSIKWCWKNWLSTCRRLKWGLRCDSSSRSLVLQIWSPSSNPSPTKKKKNETISLFLTLYKNQFQMDQNLKVRLT